MSNNEQLFVEIIPSEEASLSGGMHHRRGGHRSRIEVTADASAKVTGDTERTIVRTISDAYVDDNRVLARASTIVRAIL